MNKLHIYSWMGGDPPFYTKGEEIPWGERHSVTDQLLQAGYNVMITSTSTPGLFTMFVDTKRFQQR